MVDWGRIFWSWSGAVVGIPDGRAASIGGWRFESGDESIEWKVSGEEAVEDKG